jgi:dihydroorotase-like cyclic amidohydrolase
MQSPADYIIYKGKAALQFSLKPGKPTQIKTKKGEYIGTNKGVLFVKGANAVSTRDYDWNGGITIGLNEHEIGKLMMGLKGTTQKFFHDSNKGKTNEGEVVKTLQITKAKDGSKLFVNFSATINGEKVKIEGIPIEAEEAATLHSLLSVAIPKILGWS